MVANQNSLEPCELLRLRRTGIVLSDFGYQLLKSRILLQASETCVPFHTVRRFLRQSAADSLL